MIPGMDQIERHQRGWRGVLVALSCVVGGWWFLRSVQTHYPIGDWLLWTLLKVWGLAALFALACAGSGRALLRTMGFAGMALRHRAVFGFALGVLAFFTAMFLGGILGLYGATFAVAMPLLLAATGLLHEPRRLLRVTRALAAAWGRRRPASSWAMPLVGLGTLGLVLVYVPILSPNNVSFDAHFYHLGLAQQYATVGAIRAMPEGWTPAALPQLASILYTWPFLIPGLSLPERVIAAAHLEWALFLYTLASLPSLVRWLVPGSGRLSWVAVFAFPGLYVYDSTLCAGADHVNAAWAVPIFLALRRSLRSLSPRDSALLAAMLAGAALTKVQALYLIAFPLIAFVTVGLGSLVKAQQEGELGAAVRRLALAVGAAVGLGLLLTAPHWLKNWAFYHDPFFPSLHQTFPSPDWESDYGALFEDWKHWQFERWQPKGSTTDKLVEAGRDLFFFSVEPHDWETFHGDWPVFGSLFTLCTLPLFFVARAERTWLLVGATYLGVALWFLTLHQDRYLQTLLPWMAAVVAATAALVWRGHRLGRPLFVGLVALQAIWAADLPLVSSHSLTGRSPLDGGLDVLRAGYLGKAEERLAMTSKVLLAAAKAELPQDATVLIHERNERLGVWRPVVSDVAGWQFGIRYARYASPAAVHARLRELGVTHILTDRHRSREIDSLGSDLVFFDFVHHRTEDRKGMGNWLVVPLGDEPPGRSYGAVLYLGCGGQYERGLHPLAALDIREGQAKWRKLPRVAAEKPLAEGADPQPLLSKAQFLVTEPDCLPDLDVRGIHQIAKRGDLTLWSRR